MYEVLVNDSTAIQVDTTQLSWDLLTIKDGKFHILQDSKSYEVTVVSTDYEQKTFDLRINNKLYQVAVQDEFDQLVKQLGFSTAASKKLNHIKAPMPGLVLDILVKVGDTLQEGDSVLILEAMKMENVLKATGEAVVKEITISKGNTVDKNQILIEFE